MLRARMPGARRGGMHCHTHNSIAYPLHMRMMLRPANGA
jgi:hypothetical protein